jgi:acyl-coenzyme A synthetase/AMP-(fatty) acid ligase
MPGLPEFWAIVSAVLRIGVVAAAILIGAGFARRAAYSRTSAATPRRYV